MDFKEKFGSRLKEIRKDRGFTQNSIIDKLQESTQYDSDLPKTDGGWQSYEKGRTAPSLEGLAQIASFFGVSSDYLLGLSDEMQPQAKEFQQATGLSENAITNISRYKDFPEFMDCINQFLSSEAFVNAIGSIVIAKTPVAKIKTTDEIKENVSQGVKLHSIATGQKKAITNERITLAGERLKEWELWQASQNISKLIESIVKGDNEDGTR